MLATIARFCVRRCRWVLAAWMVLFIAGITIGKFVLLPVARLVLPEPLWLHGRGRGIATVRGSHRSVETPGGPC